MALNCGVGIHRTVQQLLCCQHPMAEYGGVATKGMMDDSKLSIMAAIDQPAIAAQSFTPVVDRLVGDLIGALSGDVAGMNPQPNAGLTKGVCDHNSRSLAEIAQASQIVDEIIDMMEDLDKEMRAGPVLQFEQEIVAMQEVMELQLCILDACSGNEEVRQKRKTEVQRLDVLCDHLEMLKELHTKTITSE
mmetsp:Transcript_22288/g.42537  ORF Transcript_22288/g.42537 Transcript_22288/m.42537 type:complete len:190 (-) Transcript_22288:532-1101(-)